MSRNPHINRAISRSMTANIGRNKAKREARAKGLRHIGKAPRGYTPSRIERLVISILSIMGGGK